MSRLLLAAVLALLRPGGIATSSSLGCVCSPSECEDVSEEDCPAGGGTVWDPCRCCRVCARIEGEPCGGPHGFHGTCAGGLDCLVSSRASGKSVLSAESEGICTKPVGNDADCESPSRAFGCNIIDNRCVCENVKFCAEESPFAFAAPDECRANLEVMLRHETTDGETSGFSGNCRNGSCDDGDDDESKCPADSSFDAAEEVCVCKSDHCYRPACRPPSRLVLRGKGSKVPGDCCDVYQCVFPHETNDSCLVNESKVVANGSSWQRDSCTVCSCINGYQYCQASNGSNCHENRGCISSSGRLYQDGESWEDDPCTKCKCEMGENKCIAYMCEVPCANPRYVPGECCPLCNGSSIVRPPPRCPRLNCSLRCVHGFVRDEAGCFTCECEAGPCLLECSAGFARDARGHLLCECAGKGTGSEEAAMCPSASECEEHCAPEGDSELCKKCECRKEACKSVTDCDKSCRYGYASDHRGCPLCKCLGVGGTDPEATAVPAHDGAGKKTCATADGKRRNEGEWWHDGCRHCLCRDGREMCNLIICPRLSCANPVFNSSTGCCAACPDESRGTGTSQDAKAVLCHSLDGTYRKEGEVWEADQCTKCICHRGQTLCETRWCPPAPCSDPIQDEESCCPRCPLPRRRQEESSGWHCGSLHPHGSVWRQGNCESCMCDNGQVVCFSQVCNGDKCLHRALQKNECCGTCIDAEMSDRHSCRVGNRTHADSAEWMEDECTRCTCKDGLSACTKEICSSLNCDNAIKKPGECCPFCFGMGEEVYYIIITVLVLVIVSLLVCIFVLSKKTRRYCVSCPDSESLPSFKTLSKPKFKYNSSDSDYTTEKEKFAIV